MKIPVSQRELLTIRRTRVPVMPWILARLQAEVKRHAGFDSVSERMKPTANSAQLEMLDRVRIYRPLTFPRGHAETEVIPLLVIKLDRCSTQARTILRDSKRRRG